VDEGLGEVVGLEVARGVTVGGGGETVNGTEMDRAVVGVAVLAKMAVTVPATEVATRALSVA